MSNKLGGRRKKEGGPFYASGETDVLRVIEDYIIRVYGYMGINMGKRLMVDGGGPGAQVFGG